MKKQHQVSVTLPCGIYKQPSLFLSCKSLSFFALTEELIDDFEARRPLHRICSLMRKGNAQCLHIANNLETQAYFEKKYPAVAEEIRSLEKQFPSIRCAVSQISFFSNQAPLRNCKLPSADKAATVLSTTILIRIKGRSAGKSLNHQYVYESVVAFPTKKSSNGHRQEILNNYFHVGAETTFVIAGKSYDKGVEAAYFCQQNGRTSACAHACLKMTLWHCDLEDTPKRYQPSTVEMNRIAKSHRKKHRAGTAKRFIPSKGLYLQEMIEICDQMGADTRVLDCATLPNVSPYEYAYLLVESGIPTIIVFAPRKELEPSVYHVLPVVGHTMNTDEWLPFAFGKYKHIHPTAFHVSKSDQYLSSAEWAPHLIVHDDMLGPYMCLGSHTLARQTLVNIDPDARIHWVIGLIKKGGSLGSAPWEIQQIAARYFWSYWDNAFNLKDLIPAWRKRLIDRWAKAVESRCANLILRTQIIKRESYIKHMFDKKTKDHYGNSSGCSKADVAKITKMLPELFWMIEVSIPELFSVNRSKVGEILLPLDVGNDKIILSDDPVESAPPPLALRLINAYDVFEENVPIVKLDFQSHITLYRRKTIKEEY